MSLTMAILMLVGMWVSVAAAMLWGCCASCAGIPTITCHRKRCPNHSRRVVRGGTQGRTDIQPSLPTRPTHDRPLPYPSAPESRKAKGRTAPSFVLRAISPRQLRA